MSTTRRTDGRPLVGVALMLAAAGCGGETAASAAPGNWTLVWQDEFDGAANSPPSPDRWTREVGGHGFGNDQLEYDTDRNENASHDGNGNLAIVARQESYEGKSYTSARLNTRDKFARAYGRFDARIRLPRGQGIWPAFWMLGANLAEVGWPQCGEIDIMEYRGQKPWEVHGSLHGPGYSGSKPVTGTYVLPGTADFDEDFHVFRVDWTPVSISWYVDDEQYKTVLLKDLPGPNVFDHPFFLLLNLAVGGGYVGNPNATTVFPQTMLVDYVRVYEPESDGSSQP